MEIKLKNTNAFKGVFIEEVDSKAEQKVDKNEDNKLIVSPKVYPKLKARIDKVSSRG